MRVDPSLLLPPPRHLESNQASWCPTGPIQLVLHADVDPAVVTSWLGPALEKATGRPLHEVPGTPRGPLHEVLGTAREVPGTAREVPGTLAGGSLDGGIALDRVEPLLDPEAYRLLVDAAGVRAVAGSPVGLLRAAATLTQWLALHPSDSRAIEGVVIDDQPCLAHRGVSLDVSRNRVPRTADLEDLVDRLARLKISQLQLYTEHTFAYAGHEAVWRGWSPLRPDEIRSLDAFCRRRGITLVPNQNSFGHFHRWLVHDDYRPLAECPDGISHPFSTEIEPFSLCAVDPEVPQLLEDLYGQLLPCFGEPAGWLNVGGDETMDLGRCRSRAACEERGRHTVYLEFLRTLSRLAAHHDRRILFWGDIVLEEPERVAELPRDAIALLWGYEADHPFERDVARFAAVGREVWVCPGTASWSSFGGRFEVACANVSAAARAAALHGASGLLLCDWGDHGHAQPPAIAWPGFAAGAAAAWNNAEPVEPNRVVRWVDHHLADDSAGVVGDCLRRLGAVQGLSGATSINGGPLFFALHLAGEPTGARRGDGMTRDGLDAVRIELAAIDQRLDDADSTRPDAALLLDELRWVIAMLDWAARFARLRLESPGTESPGTESPRLESTDDTADVSKARRQTLQADLEPLVRWFERLWLRRSRPGGLDSTLARLRSYGRWLDGADFEPQRQEPSASSR